jgi:hypothetical protein
MIVNVRPFPVLLFFLLLAVVVAMGERIVVVLVRVPKGAVFPLVQRVVRVVVRHVVVVVRMDLGGMGVLRLASLSLDNLRRA